MFFCQIVPSKVIAEITLGFWVRLFNAEFERILWKDLRRAFPFMKADLQAVHLRLIFLINAIICIWTKQYAVAVLCKKHIVL